MLAPAAMTVPGTGRRPRRDAVHEQVRPSSLLVKVTITQATLGRVRHAVERLSGARQTVAMPLSGEYEPSPSEWVRNQVAEYERSGGASGNTLRDVPVIILTTKGAKTGKIRKCALMRVEHDGRYAAVASLGGAPNNPVWYHNVLADPHVELQDGPTPIDMTAREVTGEEKAEWWARAAAVWPDYDEYQRKTDREIPVFVLEP
jgi:F420H(2)-dependent quinone reductase